MKKLLLLIFTFLPISSVLAYSSTVNEYITSARVTCSQTPVLNGSPYLGSSYFPSGFETYTCSYNVAQGQCPSNAEVPNADNAINTCHVKYFQINRSTEEITDLLSSSSTDNSATPFETSYSSEEGARDSCVNFRTSDNTFTNANFSNDDTGTYCSYIELTQQPCESPFSSVDGYCITDINIITTGDTNTDNNNENADDSDTSNNNDSSSTFNSAALVEALDQNAFSVDKNTSEVTRLITRTVDNTVFLSKNTNSLDNLDGSMDALLTYVDSNTKAINNLKTSIENSNNAVNHDVLVSSLNANSGFINDNNQNLATNSQSINNNTASVLSNSQFLNNNTNSLNNLNDTLNNEDSDGEIDSKLTGAFDSFKNSLSGSHQFTNSGASCPTWTFGEDTMILSGVTLDSHCQLAEIIRPIVSPLMLVFFSIIGFRTVFSA